MRSALPINWLDSTGTVHGVNGATSAISAIDSGSPRFCQAVARDGEYVVCRVRMRNYLVMAYSLMTGGKLWSDPIPADEIVGIAGDTVWLTTEIGATTEAAAVCNLMGVDLLTGNVVTTMQVGSGSSCAGLRSHHNNFVRSCTHCMADRHIRRRESTRIACRAG